jgi:molybdopterin-guanine dinucleotide biosynthesis protein B
MSSIVTFIGWHNSGKTTLASGVVAELKKSGYRVAVIKSSNDSGICFDSPDTDTYKHMHAGADGVLLVAPDQMVLQTGKSNLSLRALAHRYFPDVDIVIGEGFKTEKNTAKIEVCRNSDQQLREKVPGVIAVATDLEGIDGDSVFRLDEVKEIAAFIEKQFLVHEDGAAETAVLLLNGNKIPMKASSQDALTSTVLGFVKTQTFYEPVNDIELRIKIDAQSISLHLPKESI